MPPKARLLLGDLRLHIVCTRVWGADVWWVRRLKISYEVFLVSVMTAYFQVFLFEGRLSKNHNILVPRGLTRHVCRRGCGFLGAGSVHARFWCHIQSFRKHQVTFMYPVLVSFEHHGGKRACTVHIPRFVPFVLHQRSLDGL